MNYEEMLKQAYGKLPERKITTERFEIPKALGHIQGNKTVISNFVQICDIFNRSQDHLLKYLQRELATPAIIDGPRLVFGRKLSASLINAKIEQYCKEAVLCSECKKPDTKLEKENGITIIKCMVCGAKHPIKTKI